MARSAAPSPRALSRHAARRVVALTTCSTGTSQASSGDASLSLLPAAKAVMVTMRDGRNRAKASRKKPAASRSLRLVTISGAGASPRAASAVHSASTGAVSEASSSAR